MFTLDIGGKPIAVIDADRDGARSFFEGDTFKHDMQRWVSDGTPLWDGRAPLDVRPASDEEVAAFRGAEAHKHEHGRYGEPGEPTVLFLVDAYDPDDLEED